MVKPLSQQLVYLSQALCVKFACRKTKNLIKKKRKTAKNLIIHYRYKDFIIFIHLFIHCITT